MTLDQAAVQAFAGSPDAFSRGKQLAADANWVRYGVMTDQLVWGECQGSGSTPYEVSFRLNDRKYKCTCPSRQQPCKHVVGLLLRYVQQACAIHADPPPEWAQKRLQQTSRTSSKKTSTTASTSDDSSTTTPSDTGSDGPTGTNDTKTGSPPAGKATVHPAGSSQGTQTNGTAPSAVEQSTPSSGLAIRIDKRRIQLTDEGITLLEQWLKDAMRQGLAALSRQSDDFWNHITTRLVDCQLSGLVGYVTTCKSLCTLEDENLCRLALMELALLHLATRSYRQMHRLSPQQQLGLWIELGRNLREEEVRALGQRCDGQWLVVGHEKSYDEDTKLFTYDYWLTNSEGRIINYRYHVFGKGTKIKDISLLVGDTLTATWVYYPTLYPLRVAPLSYDFVPFSFVPVGYRYINDLLEAFAQGIGQNPWLNQLPAICTDMNFVQWKELWWLRDSQGQLLPVGLYNVCFTNEDVIKQIQNAHTFFGVWSDHCFVLHSIWDKHGKIMSMNPYDIFKNLKYDKEKVYLISGYLNQYPSLQSLVPLAMRGTSDGYGLLCQAAEAVLRDRGGHLPPRVALEELSSACDSSS